MLSPMILTLLTLVVVLALMVWAIIAARRWQWTIIRRERGELPPAFPVKLKDEQRHSRTSQQ